MVFFINFVYILSNAFQLVDFASQGRQCLDTFGCHIQRVEVRDAAQNTIIQRIALLYKEYCPQMSALLRLRNCTLDSI
jgi:hypothetical protein